MSGRPQGRVRQQRRERSQRSRGRDNSADSVSSTRSERERDSNRNTNGRNTRRRPERRDERSRKADDKPPERDATRSGNAEKREDKSRRGEKPPTRERNEPSRDLNRDNHGKTSNSLDRHSSAAGNDSRLSSIIKRITRETDRDRRINAARQLEEYFSSPDNIQVILKNQDSFLESMEDVMYERGLLDVKDHLVQCLVVFGGILGYDTRRFFQWIFNKLDTSSSDDIKVLLLTALSKIIQIESNQQCFREIVVNVMSLLENILENVDSPDLLYAVLSVIMSIANDYPQAFAGYFRDTVDILVGWHIDTSQQQSLTAHMSECLIQLHPYWASDIAFSLTLLGQFLEDMEAYAEELGMLASKQVSSEGVPSPYTSLPKLTALVRVLTTVVNGIGEFFSPTQTPAITIPYIEDIIQRVIQSICLSGFNFYYEKLFIFGNECLSSLCNWLQVHYASCCDQTAIFITQQLQYCQTPTYPHLISILDLLDKLIKKVGTSMPISFIKTLLSTDSKLMMLRLTPEETILSNIMKIYQGFLGIRDVQLMEATYNIIVAELKDHFNQLKQLTKTCSDTDLDSLLSDSVNITAVDNPKNEPITDDIISRKTSNQPIADEGDKRETINQPMTDGVSNAMNESIINDMVSKGAVNKPISDEVVSMATISEPITDNMVFMDTGNEPIVNDVFSMDAVNETITDDMVSMVTLNEPITAGLDNTVKAHQLQSIIIFDLCALSEIATEKSAIIGLWKLTPTLFELLTQHVIATEWTVAACYPAVQYTILHALYTHCQRNTHFLSSVKDISNNPERRQKGSLSFVLNLLSKVLASSSSSQDTRKLCLVWVMEILDLIFKSGPEITASVKRHFNFDDLENSLLPLSFNPCCYLSMEVCDCMKILIDLKLLSANCLKRCLQDCIVRLMDVNEAVQESYLSLIKALPADIITSFASRNLLQDRVKVQKTSSHCEFKQLTTRCEDVWWTRKSHIIKPPTGTFHSYNFQVIMAFIQHGILPSKDMPSDWMVQVFHTCNRPNKYTESELIHFNSSQSALWFWSTWETAQFCILSKLRTSLGRAQETFQAIEGSLNQYAKEAKAAEQDDQAKPRNKDDKKSTDEENDLTAMFPKAYASQLRTALLLQFVENLEKLMYNAHDGCTVGMPSPPKSVRVFFRTNRNTCQEWLSRIRLPAIEVGLRCGSPAIAVWHGMQILQEMKINGKLKGPDFEHTILLVCKALCEVKSPQAISGLKAWCAKNTDQEMPWINGAVLKAKGWYENAAEEYKTSLNNHLPDMMGQREDRKVKTTDGLSPASVEFLINEVADCYAKLSDWSEVEKWQKEIGNSRKNIHETELQHAMQLNLDMNYIRALSKFEEGNFTATQNHLRLIPGNCLNAITDNVKKSSWSLPIQETEMTFNPLWDVSKIQMAAELCLIQAGVLFGVSASTANKSNTKDGKMIKAVKECIHQSQSLALGALHVGCLDWPPLVSPQHILQVQQAAIMKETIDAFTQGDPVPSILQGDGSFTADPTRHNCAVLNQALRFTSHIAQLTGSLGKPKGSLNNELLTLQLETAMLARKHENYSLAQKLLLKQLVKLGVIVQPDTEPNGQNNILGSLVRGLTCVSSVKGSSRLELLRAQRECAKLAHAIGNTQDAIGILSGSILEFTKVNESDEVVRELNSRSLVTLSKWLMNDRKLLTSATKTSSNVTPLVAKMSSLCDTEEEFLGYGHSTLIGSQDEKEAKNLTLDDEMVWSGGVSSVGSGVDDMESICGQLLHLSTMQTQDLGKAWYHLAGWCYRWGRKTVEQASSMGNVELLLEEKDRALQSIPKGATDEEIDAVLSELGQAHSDSQAHDEDIGDDDQFYDNGMDITRKLLLQACPSIHDANPSCLETLLSIWKGVRDRLFKHYHYAAKAYFMYLKIGNGDATNEVRNADRRKKINKSNDDGNVTATLRLLRLLVKHAGELRSVLEEGLAHTPTRPWKDIIPQLFSRLNHPESYVRQSVSELLCRVATDAPHLIVYPAVVGSTGSIPQFLNKNKETEGLLPLLVANIQDKPSSQNESNQSQLVSMVTSDKPVKQDNDGSLESCYRTIVDSLQSINPRLVSQLQQFIQELRRITLLWEELWLGSLIQTHQDVLRRQQQLDEEIKRVNSNMTLNEQQKMTLIKEKHIAIMKPVVFALEQLQKITNHPPTTPHEQWFHRTYNTMIENALQVLRNPVNPSDAKASWEPFKQLVQTLQARSQKKSAYSLVMNAISPILAKMKNTAIYMPGQIHFGGEIVTISSISNEVNILPTKTKPKKLVFIGSDGQRHTYLFKGLEDLHLDERIMQFLSICNNMFTRADSHRCPLFYARHYSVTPLGPRSGLIQWVDGAVPLFALYKRWQQREAATTALLKSQGSNPIPQPPMKPSELFYSKMTPALKEKGIKDPKESDRKDWPLSVMRSVLEDLVKETPTDLLARELWCSSTGCLEWWHMTKTYARSTAVMSMIGYIIGLGDRHLDNMLIDFTTGEVVHIDYNVCFEKGKGLRVPEKVPFRMTSNLETALGVTGIEGMFRLSCEQVLKILRQGRETLLTLLEAFVYDPLVDWTSANDNAFASAFYGGGAAGMNDSKVNKKEMERGVTQSLFSSRVAEMKVNWTTNRDEMLAAISKQEELVNNYIASVKHLKSMDVMLEQLKEQQSTLQLAVNNTSHPLHSLQAKFDDHMKQKSNHDNVVQSIKTKLGECINWHSQHKTSMEMIHSPQFSILVADILKPLDIGVPCFAPAIKFLKGAGQGNIVSQCEQLETELVGLLHQRRAIQRACLDLIHTYATVTSQFPSNYVDHNRTYEWMCWLKELVQDSSSKMCQEVLKKSEETRANCDKTADNPLSVAAMNSLMSMEVKLQTNLTDQNSKFIKFRERRKQESVETGFLSKAVDEALGNLNKYVSDNHPSAVKCLTSVIIKVLCSQTKRCLVMENTAKVAGDRLSDLTSREGDWFLEELCSMSGNVTQLLSLLKDHPLVVEERNSSLTEELNNSIKGIFAVHKVFIALQELITNFRNIIVPEAIKSLTSRDQSVLHMLESLERLVHGEEGVTALAKSLENEMNGMPDTQTISVNSKLATLHQQFDAIQQSRNGIGKDSSITMSAGQMLLAGFNGLFTKVESELDSMVTILTEVNNSFGNKTCDVVQEAKKLKGVNGSVNSQLCSQLFFLRRLIVMTAFFKDCKELVDNMKDKPELMAASQKSSNNSTSREKGDQPQYNWKADKCFSEDELALHIRQFIAESVQKRILGLPSQAMGIIVYKYLNLLDDGIHADDKNGVPSIEEACKKVVDIKIKNGIFQQKQFSQMSSLTSAYDVAWRKHDFARRLDHNINLYKGVVQRAQLQLARFQWLYEDDLLRCPLRGNNMISPAKASIMSDMRKRVQSLVQLEPAVKAVEEKIISQQSSIEQRLKWAAGANPALNPVLKEFDKTVNDRKQLLQNEAKHSSDICSLSNALIHFEMLRTQSPDVAALDKTINALVTKCKISSSEFEKSLGKLKAISEMTTLLNITCPPETPITLGWMKAKLDSVSQEISSHKTRKTQAINAVTTKRDSLKSQTNVLKALIMTHQQLVSEVKALLTTMAKDEDGPESSAAAKLFITSYNRLSDESAQLIKSTLTCCSGKVENSDLSDNKIFDDNMQEVKALILSVTSLVHWVHDHLLSLASPIMPDDSGSNGGKTPIAAPPPTFASALQKGNATTKDMPETSNYCAPQNPVILHKEHAVQSPVGGASPSTRPAAVASPRKSSVAFPARDPKTGKALQQRNTYAISVWRKVKAKLDGKDVDQGKRMSVTDQVDHVIREATSLDNLSQMYEGWTAWV